MTTPHDALSPRAQALVKQASRLGLAHNNGAGGQWLLCATPAQLEALAVAVVASKPAPSDGTVRVCAELDRACGDFERGWCATCPKRAATPAEPAQAQGVPCGNTPYDEGPFTIADQAQQAVPVAWRDEVQRLGAMASTAMHQDARDQRNILEDIADRLSALLDTPTLAAQPAQARRAGYALVPVDPTIEMQAAWNGAGEYWQAAYSAMLAAAPQLTATADQALQRIAEIDSSVGELMPRAADDRVPGTIHPDSNVMPDGKAATGLLDSRVMRDTRNGREAPDSDVISDPRPMQTGVGMFCAPGPAAEQTQRWMLTFYDADRGINFYTDQAQARRDFARSEAQGWNCNLWELVRRYGMDDFFADGERLGITGAHLGAALAKRPEFADCLPPFQQRVLPWLLHCFGAEIAGDKTERNHRFLEESLELVQACGCTQSEAHQLVDYVFGRPVGEPGQEAGGVMVTLAALCLAQALDMHAAGETELARIWPLADKIRAKQAAKPKHSPLPKATPDLQALADTVVLTNAVGTETPFLRAVEALLDGVRALRRAD